MRILFACEYYFANSDFVKLSQELARRKHSISVVTSYRSFDEALSMGVEVYEVTPFLTIYSIPHSVSFPYSRIYKLVTRHGIDVVHALMDYSTNTAAASFVAQTSTVPFVYQVQGMGTRTGRFLVDALAKCYDWTIEGLISRSAAKVIVLSKSLISRTRKLRVDDEKVVVIPSGVDTLHFNPLRFDVQDKAESLRNELGIREETFVIGYVGRLVPAKGLPYLIEAIKLLEKKQQNIVLLIVGDGPQMAELQQIAKNLNSKTVFAGYRTDTPPFYALMDAFVLPSFYEGLPGVVLEAMAMAKPVVATPVGGTADLIVDGRNGFLIPTKNAEHMASALAELVVKDDLRRSMGKISREMVEKNFQWKDIVEKVELVYKEVA